MSTWLMDPALLKMSGAGNTTALHKWGHANKPSLFLSKLSVTMIASAFERASRNQPERHKRLHGWLDNLTFEFADRIHDVDSDVLKAAGPILSQLTSGGSRHRLHDAILVATARAYGHKLLTRREGVFRPLMKGNIEVV